MGLRSRIRGLVRGGKDAKKGGRHLDAGPPGRNTVEARERELVDEAEHMGTMGAPVEVSGQHMVDGTSIQDFARADKDDTEIDAGVSFGGFDFEGFAIFSTGDQEELASGGLLGDDDDPMVVDDPMLSVGTREED